MDEEVVMPLFEEKDQHKTGADSGVLWCGPRTVKMARRKKVKTRKTRKGKTTIRFM
jgi:hypothetical protein